MFTRIHIPTLWSTVALAAALAVMSGPGRAYVQTGEGPELVPQAEMSLDRPEVFTVKTLHGRTELLTVSGDTGMVQWRDPGTGELLRTYPLASWSSNETNSLVWVNVSLSPDGKILASVGVGDIVRLQDAWTGRILHEIPEGHGPLVFSPDGKWLVGQYRAMEDAASVWRVKIWDVGTGRAWKTLTPHFKIFENYSFTARGTLLIPEYAPNLVITGNSETWDVATGKLAQPLPESQETIPAPAHQSTMATEGAVTLMTRRTEELVPMSNVTTLRNGKIVASDGTRLWNLFTGKLIQALPGVIPWVSATAIAPDGRYMASGGGSDGLGGHLHVWNMNTARRLWGVVQDVGRWNGADFSRSGNLWTTALSFSPSDKLLAVGSAMFQMPLTVYNVRTGYARWSSKESWGSGSHEGAGVFCTQFSPDGRILAAGGNRWEDKKGDVTLWNASTGLILRKFKIDTPVRSVAFSPDGKLLACGRSISTWQPGDYSTFGDPTGGAVELWNVATGRRLRGPLAVGDLVKSLVFSHNGKVLASGGRDRTVHLWDVQTGRLLHTLSGHAGIINSLCFGADDKTIISASEDGTVKVWNVQNGHLLANLMFFFRHGSTTTQWLAFTPNGYYAASPGAERFIRWRVGDHLFPAAKYRAVYFRPTLVRRVMQGR